MLRIVVLLLLLMMSQLASAAKHFIVDTDAASDDVIAILYLLQRPDIKIDAITIVGNGEVPCSSAVRNLRGILQLMRQSAIPVACGGEALVKGQHRFPAYLTRQQETLSGTNLLLPRTDASSPQLSSVDLLVKTLNDAADPVTILALGPLTNLAAAFQRFPLIKHQITDIFVMGGAVFVPGNIRGLLPHSANTSAEWNIYVDPAAAQTVFTQSVPITLVSLDITNQVPMTLAFYNKLEKNRQTAATQYTYALLTGNLYWIRTHNFYFWDPLAAVIASDPSIAKFGYEPVSIVLTPEQQSGRTKLDPRHGHKIRIVKSIDVKRFENLLINELNRA